MTRSLLLVALLMLPACSGSSVLGIDPTLIWDDVTTDCMGNPEASLPVTYNVWMVDGPGPIPTVTMGTGEVPCGEVHVPDPLVLTPVNAAPVPTSTYFVITTAGLKTFGVTAVDAAGNESGLSAQVTVTVRSRPGIPQNFQVGSVMIQVRVRGEA